MKPREKNTFQKLSEHLEDWLGSLRALEGFLAGECWEDLDPPVPRSGGGEVIGAVRARLSTSSTLSLEEIRSSPMGLDLHRTFCLSPGALRASRFAAATHVPRNPADLRSAIPPRYKVVRTVGMGGMGRVYAARDRLRKETVAVKVLMSRHRDLLERATEVVRSLDHPGVQPIHDSGALGEEGFFLVLPLYRGKTLKDVLTVPNVRSSLLLFLRKACEGLAYAHDRGVVHRDLKPANIFLDHEARGVVLDWDLACRVGEENEWGDAIAGTPLYMAPEQVEQRPVSTATDVHALGTILYEILTGRVPSESDDLRGVFLRISREKPPPPSTLRRGVPPELDRIVLRCLEKDPRKRFPDAGALLEELEGLGAV